MVAKSYGIKPLDGGIEGLNELLSTLDMLPELAAEAARDGMSKSALAISARAKANATDGAIAQAIDTETEVNGTRVRARVFVAPAGFQTPLWPVFYEMGTGPKGIASGGDKYPLPASAYTQHPWVYFDEKLQHFVTTEGRYARPYMWPAYMAEKPFILPRVKDSVAAYMTKTGGGGK